MVMFNEFLLFHEYSDDDYEVWESFDQKGILVIFGKKLCFSELFGYFGSRNEFGCCF